MYWLAEILSNCESKWHNPWIKQDELLKWVESVHNIYFVKSSFHFGLDSKGAP